MTSTINTDTELKARHRALWGRTGDYPFIAIDMIAELGPRLVEAVGVRRGERVLDVAAGTGRISGDPLPADAPLREAVEEAGYEFTG